MSRPVVLIPLVIVITTVLGMMFVPVGGGSVKEEKLSNTRVDSWDFSNFSTDKLNETIRFLFIHHSCGGQLLADNGIDSGENCIYETHPNSGGLRAKLVDQGYEVHEASYNSEIGNNTDIFDWLPKFQQKMDKILTCDEQDKYYSDGKKNRVVAFKSCYPNSLFVGEGTPPGNPRGPDLTLWNAKASYTALLKELQKYPEVLFVSVTAPPVVNYMESAPLWKVVGRRILGKLSDEERHIQGSMLARRFNNWLKSKEGWLKGYPEKNVVVFDYYHILTAEGASNFSIYPTENGTDSHPSREGNERAAEAFVPFLNQAVRRASILLADTSSNTP